MSGTCVEGVPPRPPSPRIPDAGPRRHVEGGGPELLDAPPDSVPPDSVASDSKVHDAPSEGTPPLDGPPPFDAATCNALADAAPPVMITEKPAPNPTFTGGPIVAGTYWLTAYTYYTGLDGGSGTLGTSEQGTAVITGTSIDSIQTGGRFTDDYTTSGTTMAISSVCSAGSNDLWVGAAAPYTATSTEIDLYNGSISGGALVETWTLH